MKILGDDEYRKLVETAKDRDTIAEEVRAAAKKDRAEQFKLHGEELASLERNRKHLVEDHEIAIKRKEAEVEITLKEKMQESDAKVQALTIENNNNKKEVEILTKAFENLGFDVKDMKDILNKLVDGIVSKNIVNIVK